MLYVDLKYISLISPHLRNFKQKNKMLFNFSCPICGDSEKKKTKARGFFYQHGPSMIYKCHNCAAGMGMGNFLKSCFPTHYDEYVFEKYKSGVHNTPQQEKMAEQARVPLFRFDPKCATKIAELPDEHYAKTYVENRQIPNKFYSKLFFTDDFASLVDEVFPGKYSNLPKNDARLIIPFFNDKNELIGLQGRSFLADKSLRYITIRANPSVDLIYGLERIDYNKTVYVVEGPLDSLFLPNCVAAANSDLLSASSKLTTDNVVLVYDNEPKNKEIVKLIETAIDSNRSVCLWPKDIRQKDINDMVLSDINPNDLIRIIDQRTYRGLEAKLEFSQWKKI